MDETDVEFVAECTFHRCVDEFCASHGGAVGERNDDFFTGTAGDFCGIIQADSDSRAVPRLDETGTVAFDNVPEGSSSASERGWSSLAMAASSVFSRSVIFR